VPKELRKLKPREIEDVLCIYKDKFKETFAKFLEESSFSC